MGNHSSSFSFGFNGNIPIINLFMRIVSISENRNLEKELQLRQRLQENIFLADLKFFYLKIMVNILVIVMNRMKI